MILLSSISHIYIYLFRCTLYNGYISFSGFCYAKCISFFYFSFFSISRCIQSSRQLHQQNMRDPSERKFRLIYFSLFLTLFIFSGFAANLHRAFFIPASLFCQRLFCHFSYFISLRSVHSISAMNRYYIRTKQFQEFHNRIKLRAKFSS